MATLMAMATMSSGLWSLLCSILGSSNDLKRNQQRQSLEALPLAGQPEFRNRLVAAVLGITATIYTIGTSFRTTTALLTILLAGPVMGAIIEKIKERKSHKGKP